MKHFFTILSSLILLTACSEAKLTKEEAKKILDNQYEENCTQLLTLALVKYGDETKNKYHRQYDINSTKMLKAEKLGILDVDVTRKDYWGSITNETIGKVTNEYKSKYKAKRDQRNPNKDNYIVASSKIVDVIGISQEDNNATVQFTFKLEKNELFPFRRNRNDDNDCNMQIQEGTANLTKFDTGWRIKIK